MGSPTHTTRAPFLDALAVGPGPLERADRRHLATGRISQPLIVVLAEHHDDQIRPEVVHDLRERGAPIEVVRTREAGGDAALTGYAHERRLHHALQIDAQSRRE
jgi:hypothetical protein